jgi:triacylglycerol lipase
MWAWVLVIALAVALALVAAAWWLERRRRLRPRLPAEAATRYPIVLVHGYFGFIRLGAGPLAGEYFRGVTGALERAGAVVYRPRLPMLAGVARRARALADFITAIDAERVNVIAHSMGGLDARYALAKLGVAGKVASLITIGTPHRGTPLAELTGHGLARLLGRIARRLGFDVAGAAWLTASSAERFNDEVADAPGVFYASVVCRTPPNAPIARFLERRAGPSDGLVPVGSQAYGEVLAEIEADHWAQIGWSREYDAAGLYTRLVECLRERGL